jgi:hypothetical protein
MAQTQPSKPFGRRAVPSPAPAEPPARTPAAEPPSVPVAPQPASDPQPRSEIPPADIPQRAPLSVDEELAQWKEQRKVRKRSFREPWRSVSIVAGLGFVATSWMVPDTVANVTQLALGVLSAGSFIAGWRARRAA